MTTLIYDFEPIPPPQLVPISERYERALWELTRAQAEVRECERLMATEYAQEQIDNARSDAEHL